MLPAGCEYFSKPVRLDHLANAVHRLTPAAPEPGRAPPAPLELAATDRGLAKVFIVDDEQQVRDTVREVLEMAGYVTEAFESAEAFLDAHRPVAGACILIDGNMPGMSGLDLLRHLHDAGDALPAIMLTGQSDVAKAVMAMKAGATDYIEKPVSRDDLLDSVARALDLARDRSKVIAWREAAVNHVASLTDRQRQIMNLVLAGHPSKNIAADLKISQRTVENHRASIMRKTGAASLPALARMAVAAEGAGDAAAK